MRTTAGDADIVEVIDTSEHAGDTAVTQKTVVSETRSHPKELLISRVIQAVWLAFHLIGLVIALRFLFLLLGANVYGFAAFIYALSVPFVSMFQGIFPAPQVSGSYFDSAALLALLMWYVFGYIVTYVIALFSNRMVSE